jgi:methyl-accepting chemotaxis protein
MLALGLASVVVSLVLTALGLLVGVSARSNIETEMTRQAKSMADAQRITSTLLQMHLVVADAVNSSAVSVDPNTQGQVQQYHAELDKLYADVSADVSKSAHRDMLAAAKQPLTAYIVAAEKALTAKANSDLGGSLQALADAEQKRKPVTLAFDEFSKARTERFLETRESAARDVLMLQLIQGVGGALLAAVLVGSFVYLGRYLRKTLGQEPAALAEFVQRVAGKDFRHYEGNYPAGSIAGQLQNMVATLGMLLKDVQVNSSSIATATEQIASGNQDLSARTEQTASRLQETAASMEELATTVANSAAQATEADKLSRQASDMARQGGDVVGRVATSMAQIHAAATKISGIVAVIDGIAFQTNILALNAAVEAARAGDSGKGFAVVAQEVRALSKRSSEAAAEIKSLIGTSSATVERGEQEVRHATQAIEAVIAAVQQASSRVQEISTAAREQTQGIGLVNDAVGQLDQATQQNAALVEETAAAAESVRTQARDMAAVTSSFVLG